MMPLDDRIDRLFRLAASGCGKTMAAPAFGLEARALAAWRASAPTMAWESTVLVRGLLLAGIVTAISFWPALTQPTTSFESVSLRFADSSVPSDYP